MCRNTNRLTSGSLASAGLLLLAACGQSAETPVADEVDTTEQTMPIGMTEPAPADDSAEITQPVTVKADNPKPATATAPTVPPAIKVTKPAPPARPSVTSTPAPQPTPSDDHSGHDMQDMSDHDMSAM